MSSNDTAMLIFIGLIVVITILPLLVLKAKQRLLGLREASIMDGDDPVAERAVADVVIDRKFPGHLASKAMKMKAYGRFIDLASTADLASRLSSDSQSLIMSLICDNVLDLGLDPLEYTPNDMAGFMLRMDAMAEVMSDKIQDWRAQERYREQNYG